MVIGRRATISHQIVKMPGEERNQLNHCSSSETPFRLPLRYSFWIFIVNAFVKSTPFSLCSSVKIIVACNRLRLVPPPATVFACNRLRLWWWGCNYTTSCLPSFLSIDEFWFQLMLRLLLIGISSWTVEICWLWVFFANLGSWNSKFQVGCRSFVFKNSWVLNWLSVVFSRAKFLIWVLNCVLQFWGLEIE